MGCFPLDAKADSTYILKMDQALTRTCPVCGETESVPLLRKLELQLVRCQRCEMIYANPVPADLAIGTHYDQAGGDYLSADKLSSDYSPVRFVRELRFFRAHCQRGSVLDVGCSSGAFLYQLNRCYPGDYQIIGTDVSTGPLEHAAKMGVPIARGDFLSRVFQIDQIVLVDITENRPRAGMDERLDSRERR